MTNQQTTTPLTTQEESFHRRIIELEQSERNLRQQLQHLERMLQLVYKKAPYTIAIHEMRADGNLYNIGINEAAERMTGTSEEQWVGKRPDQIFPPDVYEPIHQRTIACFESGTVQEFEEHIEFPGGEVWTNTFYIPAHDKQGNIDALMIVAFDITERKKRQREELQQREAIIEQQSTTLAVLSTPLLTISDDVVVVPLIGSIDTVRAQNMMETLLIGIAQDHARVAIIDITGVLVVDTETANTLIQVAQAVRLLGAQVVLTGIRPEVAQTLVELGVNLNDIITRSTLQAGIAYAMSS